MTHSQKCPDSRNLCTFTVENRNSRTPEPDFKPNKLVDINADCKDVSARGCCCCVCVCAVCACILARIRTHALNKLDAIPYHTQPCHATQYAQYNSPRAQCRGPNMDWDTVHSTATIQVKHLFLQLQDVMDMPTPTCPPSRKKLPSPNLRAMTEVEVAEPLAFSG